MNRTIKFRAWTGKQMLYQDQQYLGSFLRRVTMQIMLDDGSSEPREHESYLPKCKRIDDYLMQFTGALDKHGKEIYEGDVLQWGMTDNPRARTYKRVVSYEAARACFLPNVEGDEEIIGNIYENPEPEDCGFRMLEPHEIKAAMAFPASYIITGTRRERVKQAGNAVTPPVMELLMRRCMASLQ
ncbi:MAG: YopX family protein [Ktedonobacteraceae bacterium]